MFDGQIVVYKFIQDLHFFVTGGEEENELILASVLQGFSDAVERLLKLSSLYWSLSFQPLFVLLHVIVLMLIVYECVSNLGGFRNMVDKRTALENLDLILLCLDEIVDGG